MNDFSCKIVAARKSKFIQISYLYTYKHQQWCIKKLGQKAISIHIFMKDWRDNDKFLDLMYLKTSVLAGISFLFQQLSDFNICVPVPPMLVVYAFMVDYTISSPTFFGRLHFKISKRYPLSETSSSSTSASTALWSSFWSELKSWSESTSAMLLQKICRENSNGSDTIWFGFLQQEWFKHLLFYLIVTLFYNQFGNIHKEMSFIKQSRRTAVWVEWRMRQTCLTTPRALTAFNGVKNQKMSVIKRQDLAKCSEKLLKRKECKCMYHFL